MRLTKFTDLSLRAVMRLAVVEEGTSLTSREVAEGSCPAEWCSHGSCFGSGCDAICGSGGVGMVRSS
ncbi:hypothetical protein PV666_51420, partial [Streptomyces acidiscabies]|nr:hypothetical protein [Streptomyces acidiscabies]MDX3026208.1 hypothetical protein [Streptomyces acidiscabies]MDX3797141.1 hypothetical protein [Streptomyces acidiscabies]